MKKLALLNLIVLQLFIFTSVKAVTIWSLEGGGWSTTGTEGADCGCTPAADDDIIVDDLDAVISSTMDLEGTLTIKSGGELTFSDSRDLKPILTSEVVVESGGSLIITGDFLPEGNSIVTVEDGGSIEITARLEIRDDALVTIRGTIVMNGDKMAISGDANLIIESTGSLSLPNGRMDINSATGTLTVDGTLDMDGLFKLGTGTMTGTGVITNGGCSGGGTINGYDENVFCDAGLGGVIDLAVLPIELLYFEGRNNEEENVLQWATASETNNDFFTIEHAIDGVDFLEMAQIPGAGTSTAFLEYQWIDKYPVHGLNYYRLKQTDYDGQFTYSDMIVVKTEFTGQDVEVFPNPVIDDEITIRIKNHARGEIVVNIYSSMGQKIVTREYNFNHRSALIKVGQMHQLNPGYHFMDVIMNETSIGKFKILKSN